MVWKFGNDRPVYLQIIEQLQGEVLSGQLQPGDRIPSVRDLALQARVNPNTVQHALQELEATGLLVTEGTSGRFVTQDLQVLQAMKDERLAAIAEECAKRFAAFGVSPDQAAKMLQNLKTERTDV